jgi:hypothetical protein
MTDQPPTDHCYPWDDPTPRYGWNSPWDAPDPPSPLVIIGAVTDPANRTRITVALDCDGFVRMRCLDDSGGSETGLSRDEAHRLAHVLHDAVTWPDMTDCRADD